LNILLSLVVVVVDRVLVLVVVELADIWRPQVFLFQQQRIQLQSEAEVLEVHQPAQVQLALIQSLAQ
jgi:hypothetical protein